MIDIELKTTLEDAEKIAELLESHGEGFGWYAMVLRDQIKDYKEGNV